MKLILKLWLENCAQKNYDILFWSSFLAEKRTVLEKHGRIFASCREGISHSTSGFNFYFHVYSFTVYTNKNIYIYTIFREFRKYETRVYPLWS